MTEFEYVSFYKGSDFIDMPVRPHELNKFIAKRVDASLSDLTREENNENPDTEVIVAEISDFYGHYLFDGKNPYDYTNTDVLDWHTIFSRNCGVVPMRRCILEKTITMRQFVSSITLYDDKRILIQKRPKGDFSEYSLIMGHCLFNKNTLKYTAKEYLYLEGYREFVEEVKTNQTLRDHLLSQNMNKIEAFAKRNSLGTVKQVNHTGFIFIVRYDDIDSILEHNDDLIAIPFDNPDKVDICDWTYDTIKYIKSVAF